MDIIQPFMVENGLARGVFISADQTFQEIWKQHDYPAILKPLLHEAVLLALALSAGIKYQGVFALQVQGNDGPVKTLYVDVRHDKSVRAYAVFNAESLPSKAETIFDLLGENAQLLFSVAEVGHEPYQGIVAVRHPHLSDVVRDYFKTSEQIDTTLILRHEGEMIRVLLLQKMPDKTDPSPEEQADLWETLCILMNSVQDQELFSETLTPEALLFRLFHANNLRLFPSLQAHFSCPCHKSRMREFLRQMPAEQRAALYQGETITAVCQFCGTSYTFLKKELETCDTPSV